MTVRHRTQLELGSATLDVSRWCPAGASGPPIILLHDGLGSIGQWRDVPKLLADRTGSEVVAYDRPSHGNSTPVADGPWPSDWLHREATRLLDLLEALGISRAHLVGHSDGGSVSLIAATERPDMVASVVTLAAHTWVEDICRESIQSMRSNAERIVSGLSRSHAHPDAVFWAWSGVWVTEEFGRWDIRPTLGKITCPVLIVQGTDDEYATPFHVESTVKAIGENATGSLLPGIGHLLHYDNPHVVVETVASFFREQSTKS